MIFRSICYFVFLHQPLLAFNNSVSCSIAPIDSFNFLLSFRSLKKERIFFGSRMAAVNYQGSSSSSFSHCKYHVFLSFRGKDTRKNFIDHLYKALVQAGIHTFRDDDEIQRGENIELELDIAIKQSKISIIVFSEDYCSSSWCLDELVMIMEQRRIAGWVVLPVFYGVEPSQVRNQTGSFGTSFVEHEKRFKEEMERVNGWRTALKEVADLKGKELRDGYEAQFVESIVKEVSKKLDLRIFNVPCPFIGRDSKIDYISSWLQDGSHGAAIGIIFGVGGVGKTTIAKCVYNQNFHKFEGASFLAKVRERSKASNGLECLQRQLVSDILNKTASEIYDVDEGIKKIEGAICCRRTLIVLDDVEERNQFNAIIGMQNYVCRGSKIIVTTRNKNLISDHAESERFEIKPLDDEESLELFSWHAFGLAHPTEDFAEHSKRVVLHCNGLPLALGVIGSLLRRKEMKVWESALQYIEETPYSEVLNVLKVSYDSLDDGYHKNLFLDIACFFNGMKQSHVVKILDELGPGAVYMIDNLIDRCLLEIERDERLSMHQLIRDMGREVARQESSRCQRIWLPRDACTALEGTIEGAAPVRGLTLDMHALKKDNCKVFCTDALRMMQNVKFLQLYDVKFDGSYQHFPKSLVSLCWHGFSLESLPKHLCLEKLVVLDLSRSKLVDVWKGKMDLPNLKILDLRHSRDLLRTPDLSGVPCLEELILEGCVCLVQIHESTGDLSNLLILNLRNCRNLVELPDEVSRLDSLQVLDLDGCSNLDLEQLQPHWNIISRRSISDRTALLLKLIHPCSWFSTRNTISRRTSFEFPRYLVELNLTRSPIRSLPESIRGLATLTYLWLGFCQELQTLPELPSNVVLVNVMFCSSLQRIRSVPAYIDLQKCENLVDIQDMFKLELIQRASLHVLRMMETIIAQRQPPKFGILLSHEGDSFHISLPGRNEFLISGEWVIQNEFKEYFSFKIPTSAERRIIHGVYLFTLFSGTLEYGLCGYPSFEMKNNTKGRRITFFHLFIPYGLHGMAELSLLSQWKCEEGELDDGDEVSVSVHNDNPDIQIKMVGVQLLWCKEEGSGNEITVAHDNNFSHIGDEHEHVAKARMASYIFNNYSCSVRYNIPGDYRCFYQIKDE